MIVGFMRNAITPPVIAKITAIFCKYQGIDLIYITPENVKMKENKVIGKMFINNKWSEVETNLPSFIDISPYCFKKKNNDIMQYLRSNTLLSYDNINNLSKERLQKELMKSDDFSHLVIPTMRLNQFSNIEDFLIKYSIIVLKPVIGERGKGVYILRKEKEIYILGYQKKETKYTLQELKAFYEKHIKGAKSKYILQKYISSRTLQGDPFDCRVHVQKNGKGNWVVAKNFIRIGIGQTVMSNVNQGGGISDLQPFLKSNFDERWKDINFRINNIAKTLPYKIEKIRNVNLMTLGFDIAIDKYGELYLFEANGAPTTKPLRSKSAMLRADYYKYVLNNKGDKKSRTETTDIKSLKNKLIRLEREYEELKKEKVVFQKKCNVMENSTSWKITKPIRKVGKLIKK